MIHTVLFQTHVHSAIFDTLLLMATRTQQHSHRVRRPFHSHLPPMPYFHPLTNTHSHIHTHIRSNSPSQSFTHTCVNRHSLLFILPPNQTRQHSLPFIPTFTHTLRHTLTPSVTPAKRVWSEHVYPLVSECAHL